MSKLSITRFSMTRACAAAALLAIGPAALAQENTANTTMSADPSNMTADPLAGNAADPLATDPLATDPLANDPMATTTTDPLATDPMMDTEQDDDGDFPWGLLGLLGLAGLLGMNRRDDRDARSDTRRDGV